MKSVEIIRALYDNFSHYFKTGDIIIGGSHFYSKLGIPIQPSFKDIDLIVDSSKDFILYEINDFFKKSKFGYSSSSFIKSFDGKNLISCIVFNYDYCPIDILRNDFSTNLSEKIEIVPGVFSNFQSSEKLSEVYGYLIDAFRNSGKGDKIKKFEILKEFYDNNDIGEVVTRIMTRQN